jgi:hypothetical protein
MSTLVINTTNLSNLKSNVTLEAGRKILGIGLDDQMAPQHQGTRDIILLAGGHDTAQHEGDAMAIARRGTGGQAAKLVRQLFLAQCGIQFVCRSHHRLRIILASATCAPSTSSCCGAKFSELLAFQETAKLSDCHKFF